MHPSDRADYLEWLIAEVKRYSPNYAADQLNRNRMHQAEQDLADARREARA